MINSQLIDIDYNGQPGDVVDNDRPLTDTFLFRSPHDFFCLDPNTPLFLYMQGHGSADGRFIVLGNDE
ncbi:MAG: hypothetical protein R2941_23550 [Desulfobacterales bacterium]